MPFKILLMKEQPIEDDKVFLSEFFVYAEF